MDISQEAIKTRTIRIKSQIEQNEVNIKNKKFSIVCQKEILSNTENTLQLLLEEGELLLKELAHIENMSTDKASTDKEMLRNIITLSEDIKRSLKE